MANKNANFENELRLALEAANEASILLTKHFGKLTQIEEKFKAGLVSEADREAEAVIKKILDKSPTPYGFLGEEEAFYDPNWMERSFRDKTQWVVDPLDGTTNYIHCFPAYCVSIALVQNGDPVVGVIQVPQMNEIYWAVRGQGAFRNGKPIQVSSNPILKKALAATGFYGEDEEALKSALQVFAKILLQTRGVRRAGSAAYDLCMVANGVFDFYWEKDLKPWDVAAGQLLVQEAGGRVSDYKGTEFHPWLNSLFASNTLLHEEVLSILKQHEG